MVVCEIADLCDSVPEVPSNIELANSVKNVQEAVRELEKSGTKLTERVDSHIKFFWGAPAIPMAWLAWTSITLMSMNTRLTDVARMQSDSTSQIVSQLLLHPAGASTTEVTDSLADASVVLRRAKIGEQKPNDALVERVASVLTKNQQEYPDLPEVWKTTADFINYKYAALLQPEAQSTIWPNRSEFLAAIFAARLARHSIPAPKPSQGAWIALFPREA